MASFQDLVDRVRTGGAVSLDLTASPLGRLGVAALALDDAFRSLLLTLEQTRFGFSELENAPPRSDRSTAWIAGAGDLLRAERDRLRVVEDSNEAYRDGSGRIADLVFAHERAAGAISSGWETVARTFESTFRTVFDRLLDDGKLSLSEIFESVKPLLSNLLKTIARSAFDGLSLNLGGVLGAGGGAVGGPLGGLLGGLPGPLGGGSGGLAGGLGGIFGTIFGGGSGVPAGLPFGFDPVSMLVPFGLNLLSSQLFSRSPSVGPTTISRLIFPMGRGSQIGTADNGGDPDALHGLTDEVFDAVDSVRRRFGAGYRNFGLDIGYFPDPESGSGRAAGYTLSTILNGVLGQDQDVQGLTEPELIEKAVYLALKRGLQDFDVAEVGEAARNSSAEDLDGLLGDLDFADLFGRLRAEFERTGEAVDHLTLALARQRVEAERAGRQRGDERFAEILEAVDRMAELFDPGVHPAPPDGAAGPATVTNGFDWSMLEQDESRISALPPGVRLIEDPSDEGRNRTLGGFAFGDDVYRTALNPELGRQGRFEVLDAEGEVLGAVDGMVEALRLVGEGGVARASSPSGALDDAAAAAYQANIDRLSDGIDFARADVEGFVETLVGAFDVREIGPFEKRLLEGRGAIAAFTDQMPALNERLDDLKERFPELSDAVDAFVADTTATLAGAEQRLREALQADFEKGIQVDLRAATGLGVVDTVQGLVDASSARRRDGLAIGADVGDLDELLRAEIGGALAGGVSLDAVDALRDAFGDNAIVMDALADSLDLSARAANDNAAAQTTLADITAMATRELSEQIGEQEALARSSEHLIEQIADTRRRIRLDDGLSILDPAERLQEARLRFEDLSARARGGEIAAQQELSDAGTEYLELARAYYASSEDYAAIFNQVDQALANTETLAERQLHVAEEQLEALRSISRSLSGEPGDLPNPNADFGHNPTRNRLIARITGYGGDFGSGGFGEFRSGLSDDVNRLVDAIAGAVNFADGGVMTAVGPLSLSSYATGGIADRPQLALFGEGRSPEAYVPLPDGRTIPVTVTAPANDGFGSEAESRWSERSAIGIESLLEETRRLRSEIEEMRVENGVLRRTLERTVAGARSSGRVA